MPFWYHKTESLQWLTGSIREDLIPDERSVWADLMALAAITREPRRGYIERSEGIPYSKAYIVSFLNISEELFDRAVAKCVKEGRLQILGDGTMYLTNWNRYNDTTDYTSRRKAKEASIAKGVATRMAKADAVVALTRITNELNKTAKKMKDNLHYELRDGKIVNTVTGEVFEPTTEDLDKAIYNKSGGKE